MSEATRNMFVGLFVMAALILLSVLMVWFGETPSWLRRSDWELRVTGVHNLHGIAEASPVTLNGVQIGRVARIEFADPSRPDRGVVIVTHIQRGYAVPRSAVARVYGATLGFGMGHIDVVLLPGKSLEPLERKDAEIPGEMRSTFSEIISSETVVALERAVRQMGDLAEEAKPAARNMALLLEQRPISAVGAPDEVGRPLAANLSTLVERFERILAHADEVLGDPNVQAEVRDAVADLRGAAADLKSTVELWRAESQKTSENLNAGIDRTEAHLDRSFAKLNEGLDNLDAASKNLTAILQKVEAGEGTLGLLARDERLYEAAVITLQRLGELVGTVQRIAGKIEEDGYITVGQTTPVGTFTKKLPVGPDEKAE